MLDAMKTVTTREFIHAPGLVRSLRPGQSLLVTDNGKPSFTVTKAGERKFKTGEDLEREAREICPDRGKKVNFTAMLRELKK
jgi:antitoxin (DNA-binding transcriptional repressor) of toxin-antitoxin stability system